MLTQACNCPYEQSDSSSNCSKTPGNCPIAGTTSKSVFAYFCTSHGQLNQQQHRNEYEPWSLHSAAGFGEMLGGGTTAGNGMCTGRPAGPPGLKLNQILVMLAATTRMNSRESLLLDSVLYVAMMLTFMCFSLVCQVCEGLWCRHHASVRNSTNVVESLTSSFLALYRYCTCDSRVCQQSKIYALYATPWAASSL